MKIGIIGCGSMGKMLLRKFSESGGVPRDDLLAANRTVRKLEAVSDIAVTCGDNRELAERSDIVFVCVRPSDMKHVIREIKDCLRPDALPVSLNGSISFDTLGEITRRKMAKVIPGITAEINRSQTLVCFNELAGEQDRETLAGLLSCMGDVIELPENEMGMGSELVSCMPGFIASMFDVITRSAQKHTNIPEKDIIRMVLNTMNATSELMLRGGLTFDDVVSRVATKGGITGEGTKVIYELFPDTADTLFEKTLEKRRLIAEEAKKSFE